MKFLIFVVYLAGCGSVDPSWVKFQKELDQYEEADLKCLVADAENAKNKAKNCGAVLTK